MGKGRRVWKMDLLVGAMVLGVGPVPLLWAQPQEPPAGITGSNVETQEGGDEGTAEPQGQQPQPAESATPSEAPRPTAAPVTQQERLRTMVNLSFTNASLKTVLNSLAKTYGLNIVAGEAVAGNVTLTLRQVTLEEGLRQILKLNGFGFLVHGEILEVAKSEEKRVAESIPLKYINSDTALEFIQPLGSEHAVLKVDESGNAILVSDFMDKIEEMRNVLAEVDRAPQQVLIESRLIDITHTDLDNLGYALTSIANTIPLRHETGAKIGDNPPLVVTSTSSTGVSLAGPSSDLTSTEFGFTAALGNDVLTVAINALIRNKRVKVIANPSVLTLNNIEAKITIGEKFPIREQTQTTTGTLETTRFVDIGTTLRVTPRINRDGYIQLHIHPEVSSVSSTLDAGPRITTREADTTVLVKDTQPIVIAGLLKEDETKTEGRVPVLGHIPLVGLLFQNRAKTNEQKELVIVITPTLVEATGPEEPKAAVQEVASQLDVTELFNEAVALEEGVILKARRMPEVLRYLRAAQIYQHIAESFPKHPYAAEALWRMGRIAREPLHDLDRAESAYQQLVDKFPEGPHRRAAERELKTIRRQQMRLEGKRVRISPPAAKL